MQTSVHIPLFQVQPYSPRRYAFRSLEKAALQEIGPRFTLKPRWIKKGVPAVKNLGAPPPPLVLASDVPEGDEEAMARAESGEPPKGDEYLWQWKVSIKFIIHH
jgi:ribosome production factor 1